MNKFYMVYATNGRAPMVRHDTREAAECEAIRLAMKEGVEVFVLEATHSFKKPPSTVIREELK